VSSLLRSEVELAGIVLELIFSLFLYHMTGIGHFMYSKSNLTVFSGFNYVHIL